VAPAIALVTSTGRIIPRGQGSTEVLVRRRDDVVRVPVTVSDYSRPDPIDFQTDVIAALSKAGCNQGAVTDRLKERTVSV